MWKPAVALFVALVAVPVEAQICGDCDSSLVLTIIDALVGAQIAAGITVPTFTQTQVCDVQGDLDVDVIDALLMAQAAAGLPVVLSCPNPRPVAASCLAPPSISAAFLLPYELSDGDSSPVDIVVEFSTDAGLSWTLATQGPGGSPLTGLAATPTPATYWFSWDLPADLPSFFGPAVARVTPSDSVGVGTPCTTQSIAVDTNGAPVASACAQQAGLGTAAFVYTNPDSVAVVPGMAIDPVTGALTNIPGSPFPRAVASGGFTTNSQAAQQLNGFLYACNATQGSVSGFAVNPSTGALTELAGSPFATPGAGCTGISADEARGFLAITGSVVCVMQQNPTTGALTHAWTSPGIGSALGVEWHPTLGVVYVSNGWSQITAYQTDAAGVGTVLPGAPYPSSGYCHVMRINAAGTLLFSDNLTAGVDVWDIHPTTGVPTRRPASPYSVPGMSSALGVALDEAGDRLFLGCRSSGPVGVFTGLASGNLVFQTTFSSQGNQPVWLEVADNRLFITHEGIPISVFDIPPGGAITAVPGSPFTPSGGASGGVSSSHVFRRAGSVAGQTTIAYALDDADGHSVDLTVEYSLDGITFLAATQGTGGDPVTGLSTTPGMSTSYRFAWDHTTDVPGGSTSAHVRITPSDPFEPGTPCTVGPFTVP